MAEEPKYHHPMFIGRDARDFECVTRRLLGEQTQKKAGSDDELRDLLDVRNALSDLGKTKVSLYADEKIAAIATYFPDYGIALAYVIDLSCPGNRIIYGGCTPDHGHWTKVPQRLQTLLGAPQGEGDRDIPIEVIDLMRTVRYHAGAW